jgi:hypothetical protein
VNESDVEMPADPASRVAARKSNRGRKPIRHIRPRLTFANVVSVIALFVALGGTALASIVVSQNSQVARRTISGHRPPSGKHPNIIAGSITGKDIAKFSGVDTCTRRLLTKFGRICAASDGLSRDFEGALAYCSDFRLHLPSLSEGVTLARNHNVPGVPNAQSFWTDDEYFNGEFWAQTVTEDGLLSPHKVGDAARTVCVANPTN